MSIHSTAQIDARAEIDPTAEIGPFVVIDGPVRIGTGTRVLAHAVLTGHTVIGANNVIHYGAVVGHDPQDVAFRPGTETWLRLGDRNVIREHVTLHRGTSPGSATVIGDDNYLMAHAHVAHNARLGNQVILVNGALLAGHVEVGDRAFVSGNCTVHQHVRLGRLSLVRGGSRATRDVPPFCIMDETGVLRGVNTVGMRRAGYEAERVRAVKRAFARMFRQRTNLGRAVEELAAESPSEDVQEMLSFIRESRRGVCAGPRQPASESSC